MPTAGVNDGGLVRSLGDSGDGLELSDHVAHHDGAGPPGEGTGRGSLGSDAVDRAVAHGFAGAFSLPWPFCSASI